MHKQISHADDRPQRELLAPLFLPWNKTMVHSFLGGDMGYAIAYDENLDCSRTPRAAQIVVGDFCFFAGVPSSEAASDARAPIIIPRDAHWHGAIEAALGDDVIKTERFATSLPRRFDIHFLRGQVSRLAQGYTLQAIDASLYADSFKEPWSADLCAQFESATDFLARGIGTAITKDGELVCGASSYTVFGGGIEIEIDTKPAYRKRGLATVCAAALILSCTARGLAPYWDAHDARSLALAQKLGYESGGAYTTYLRRGVQIVVN